MARLARPISALTALFGLLLIAACGSSEEPAEVTGPTETKVIPSTPKGTVWGAVLAAGDHQAIADAAISLSAEGEARETFTDEDGMFSFADVPAGGEVGLSVSRVGYTRANLKVAVPGHAGDFPADGIGAFVGPVALFPKDGEMTVRVIGHDGARVDGAKARVVAEAAFVDLEVDRVRGVVAAEAVSEDGLLEFSGLPNLVDLAQYGASLIVVVEPVQGDDGAIRHLGETVTYSAAEVLSEGGRMSMMLSPPGRDAPLLAIAGNVGSLLAHDGTPKPGDSVIGVSEPVRVVFNQPVDPATLEAAVFDQSGTNRQSTVASVEGGNVVTITPENNYGPGRGYHVLVSVQATGTTSEHKRAELVGSFFTAQPAGVGVARVRMEDRNGSGFLDAGDRVRIELTDSIGLGHGEEGFSFPVYFDLDLDRSGKVGDAHGELGSGEPIWAVVSEATPPNPLRKAGFSRSFTFLMPEVTPVNSTPENPRPPYSYVEGASIEMVLDIGASIHDYQRLMTAGGRLVQSPAPESLTVAF